ncbi:MAG: hypothetical protein IPO36_20535 [Anaerolineales bacterium]|nr:hypothetical protein [Anaerolineales bacterium]
MFQTDPALRPEMTELERQQTIRDAFNRDRSQMTLMLAHKLRIPEVEIIRALEDDTAHELDFSRWEEIIRAFEPLGNVHVILSNGAVTIEAFGQFGNFTNSDGFLNVRTKSLDMHIRSWEWIRSLPSVSPAISMGTSRSASNSSIGAGPPRSKSSSISAAKSQRPTL